MTIVWDEEISMSITTEEQQQQQATLGTLLFFVALAYVLSKKR